ncbi:Cysteine-rich membrane protein 2 [Spironucleus salmonicida]|uniref:Cysteine-rich membrane protein 2 n=1 Tax=Spironucleus salmonicida TaxID=348837 RepID=V6LUE2_9EUKA|nr:Cysteine-rich membrane protein 2 [Spironucleus salmonicida]|eukprot:EST47326.1 Cysteine-rich membrane protein 2 [Spironucleus salmonicida]
MTGTCSDTINKCETNNYCPVNPGINEIFCVQCTPNMPVHTFCHCSEQAVLDRNCIECKENECTNCRLGYFIKEKRCTKCMENCNSCVDETTCTKCINSFYLTNGTCNKCLINCQNCQNKSTCELCALGQSLTIEKTCSNCPENCARCNNQNKCKQCSQSFTLSTNNTCDPCQTITTLAQKCQCGNRQISGCLDCSIDNISCKTCLPGGRFLYNRCVIDECQTELDCNKGYFCFKISLLQNTCIKCRERCASCKGGSSLCTSCHFGEYLDANFCKKCEIQGPTGFSCQCGDNLISNCGLCTGNSCQTCIHGFSLVNGVCQVCSDNIEGDSCQCNEKYIMNCTECGEQGCQKCINGYIYDGQVCKLSSCEAENFCGNGMYCDTTSSLQTCKACIAGCSSCLNGLKCDICQNNSFLKNQICVTCSQNNTDPCNCDGQMINGCTNCNGTQCQTCSSGMYLKANQCNQCMLLQLGEQCQCGLVKIDNCIQCGDSGQCNTCVEGAQLVDHVCIDCTINPEKCDNSYISTNSIIGIIAGIILLLILIILGITFAVVKYRKRKEKLKLNDLSMLVRKETSSSQLLL